MMIKDAFYDGLKKEEINTLKRKRKQSYINCLCFMTVLLGLSSFGVNEYYKRQNIEIHNKLVSEISKINDITVANDRKINEKRQITQSNDNIYKTDINLTIPNDSITGTKDLMNFDMEHDADYEVYGGIYEEMLRVANNTQDEQYKTDLKLAMEDGKIMFNEYRALRTKHDLNGMLSQAEANKLKEIINKTGQTK